MHRAQILLDDWQYAALKARAQREGRSMSEMLRELLATQLGRPDAAGSGLSAIEGIGEDRAACGRDHDRFLYGKVSRRR
ncbi:MAG: ribbon-helix-helix protein, CopG family [Gammaproteobacteria bacterium]|nr:ribbon-helix-helix protein, CopG family [Gammaproteobacteria bacterium]